MANNFGNSINSNIGASNSGATNTLTITNPSNTASSQALVNVTVGGTSAGDAFTTYTVAGTTNWSEGVDNSASDAFVISASTALGTTNVVSMATGGNVSVVLGDLDVTRSSSGGTVTSTVSNTSNTATSNALQQVTVAGTSANDPFTTYTVAGTTNWSHGIDNSVTGDPFVLAASTALGTTNVMIATTAGELTYPLQPAFLAQLSASDLNVTGNGTSFTVGSGNAYTEIFDQGGDFNTNGTFTAPVTGRYFAQTSICCAQVTNGTNTQHVLTTSNRAHGINSVNFSAIQNTSSGLALSCGSVLADMDAADTMTNSININGIGADTADVSNASTRTFFSAYLAC